MRTIKSLMIAAAAALPLLAAVPTTADAQGRRAVIAGGGFGPRVGIRPAARFGYVGTRRYAYRGDGLRRYGYRRGGFGRGLALGLAFGAVPLLAGSSYYYDRPWRYGYGYRPYRYSYGYRPYQYAYSYRPYRYRSYGYGYRPASYVSAGFGPSYGYRRAYYGHSFYSPAVYGYASTRRAWCF